MRAKRHFKKGFGSTVMAVLVLLLASAEARAWNLLDYFRDGFKWATDSVAKYAENTVGNAIDSARKAAGAAGRGDFDAVASEVILLQVGPGALGPFRDTLLDAVNKVAQQQVSKYTQSGISTCAPPSISGTAILLLATPFASWF